MLFLLACASAPTAPDPTAALVAAELGALRVERELVVDLGHVEAGGWVVDAEEPGITVEGAPVLEGRVRLELPWGASTVEVHRRCGVVRVPVRVGVAESLPLPLPACSSRMDTVALGSGARLDRWERSWGEVAALAALGIVEAVAPPPEGEAEAPARYVDHADAAAVCAFWGGRLPTEAEWREAGGGGPPSLDPEGPRAPGDPGVASLIAASGVGDLDGGVSEWLASAGDGVTAPVAGASWLRAAEVRAVPKASRSDEIGFRCVFSGG